MYCENCNSATIHTDSQCKSCGNPVLANRADEFMFHELWVMSFSAAVQHCSTYRKHQTKAAITRAASLRNDFRESMKNFVLTMVRRNYLNRTTSEEHIANIIKVSEEAARLSRIYQEELKAPFLLRNRLRLGQSQKMLNLMLKYLWCSGKLPEPPHCPVDDLVVRLCNPRISNIRKNKLTKWTKITRIEQYKKSIKLIEDNARNDGLSIAAWELKEFRRRGATQD